MICCVCVNKCENKIRELIKEGHDLDSLKEEYGVGTGCGLCIPYVEEMIEDENNKK